MSDEIRLDGIGVAPNVLDTIVTVAASEVEGVAAVGAAGLAGLRQKGARKGAGRAVDVVTLEDGGTKVAVHVQALYGSKLQELGREVQRSVADALASQIGVTVAEVDVYVDSLVFPE